MKRTMLKNRRISLGYTQSYVAENAGITRTFYTEIENGNRNCSIETWARIFSVLSIPKSEFYSYIANEKGA